MAKSSRKGKRAWRKNIDTAEIEAAVEAKSRNERLGADVGILPDSELFFIDKAKSGTADEVPSSRPAKSQRGKVLRSQAIIDAAHQARPVIKPALGKKQQQRQKAALPKAYPAAKAATVSRKPAQLYDIWKEDSSKERVPEDFANVAEAIAAKQITPFGPVRPAKRRKAKPPRPIRPVEIDEPGCSYNPDREQHEETVAHAVAVELQKKIDAEMRAKPPATHVDWQAETDPLLEYQVEEQEEESEEELEGTGLVPRRRPHKKTRTVRNKEARVKGQEAELAARQKVKQQRRELQNLDSIGQEISEVEQERERRQQRRERLKAEKALSQPPRLGKMKYQEAATQVLLTSDISGSLRKLKPAAMLARERFNSLQKRGIVEPRQPVMKQQKRKRIEFMHGQQGEKNRDAQKELEQLRKARKR
ncbi:g7986 [Coccomyxa elongata]